MRKTLTLLTLLICSVSVFAVKVNPVDVNVLPETAQKFIKTHFPKLVIKSIDIEDSLLGGKKYDVEFTNGFDVEFDNKGVWFQIDCEESPVPNELIPVKIAEYIKQHFPGDFITQIELSKAGYEVELHSDLFLEFDKNQKFKRIDN